MADEVLRRAARAITDLRRLAKALNDAGFPGPAIRLQGFAGLLRALEGELVQTQSQMDAELILPIDADELSPSSPDSCWVDGDQPNARRPSGRLRVSPSAR